MSSNGNILISPTEHLSSGSIETELLITICYCDHNRILRIFTEYEEYHR